MVPGAGYQGIRVGTSEVQGVPSAGYQGSRVGATVKSMWFQVLGTRGVE